MNEEEIFDIENKKTDNKFKIISFHITLIKK